MITPTSTDLIKEHLRQTGGKVTSVKDLIAYISSDFLLSPMEFFILVMPKPSTSILVTPRYCLPYCFGLSHSLLAMLRLLIMCNCVTACVGAWYCVGNNGSGGFIMHHVQFEDRGSKYFFSP